MIEKIRKLGGTVVKLPHTRHAHVPFKVLKELTGLRTLHYRNSGRVRHATVNGVSISNVEGDDLLGILGRTDIYWNEAKSEFVVKGSVNLYPTLKRRIMAGLKGRLA